MAKIGEDGHSSGRVMSGTDGEIRMVVSICDKDCNRVKRWPIRKNRFAASYFHLSKHRQLGRNTRKLTGSVLPAWSQA